MERYVAVVLDEGREAARLLVLFSNDATFSQFTDEVLRRLGERGMSVTRETHTITIQMDADGQLGSLDASEKLSSMKILALGSEKIYVRYEKKSIRLSSLDAPAVVPHISLARMAQDEVTIPVRVITPALAKTSFKLSDVSPLSVPVKATLQQLHDMVAKHLAIPLAKEAADIGSRECNCAFAGQLTAGGEGVAPTHFTLIHGKSIVERLTLLEPTRERLLEALKARFGDDVEVKKKINLYAAEMNSGNVYFQAPVVSLCAQERHTAGFSRPVDGDSEASNKKMVLDLHTAECYIHPASFGLTVQESNFQGLAMDGATYLFVVKRVRGAKDDYTSPGKDKIFHARDCWIPSIAQSPRGVAMFLSSLRVLTHLIESKNMLAPIQDCILHLFDVLTQFPPATRCLHILMHGRTPTFAECAALSDAMFHLLEEVVPEKLINCDVRRRFEGSRLLFGLLLEKANYLKLDDDLELPYLAAHKVMNVRCTKTGEALLTPVLTSIGLVEAAYFEAFQEGGTLSESRLQECLVKKELDGMTRRVALLSGQIKEPSACVASATNLAIGYPDAGDITKAIGREELREVHHLAVICGRNKLSVLRPGNLATAVAPALTFDRDGLVAVYTGRAPCAEAGRDMTLFRPLVGETVIDVAIITQLIAPILAGYDADGTSVFDASGDVLSRRLEEPEEALLFCIDTSMSEPTGFEGIESESGGPAQDTDADPVIEGEIYATVSLDETKAHMTEHESFEDMVAIVSEAESYFRKRVTDTTIEVLRIEVSSQLKKAMDELESLLERRLWGGGHHARIEKEAKVVSLKAFLAGLRTHEHALREFLLYRGANVELLDERWTFSTGDAVPTRPTLQCTPTLPVDLTTIPHDLRCSVSYELLEDPVTTSDGHTYGRRAIQTWLSENATSPRTGLVLQDRTLRPDHRLAQQVADWVEGKDILIPVQDGAGIPQTQVFAAGGHYDVEMSGRLHTFVCRVPTVLTVNKLYNLAYRGMKGRYSQFQLLHGTRVLRPSEATIFSQRIRDSAKIRIQVQEDEQGEALQSPAQTQMDELCLIKVYESPSELLFSYWVPKSTERSLASIIFKYWRYSLDTNAYNRPTAMTIWTNMTSGGDGHLRGTPQNSAKKAKIFLDAHRKDDSGRRGVQNAQQPLVLKIWISPDDGCSEKKNVALSRLDVVKQMFEALINRILAYNYKTHVGLVSFANTAKVDQSITHVIEDFRASLNSIKAGGDTAIWDALMLAQDQLVHYATKYPTAKKRIICLTDGEDTKSLQKPYDVYWQLKQQGILVDSICIGSEDSLDLRTISYLLGSYAFKPATLPNALKICELEPVLCIEERPQIQIPTCAPENRINLQGAFHSARARTLTDIVSRDKYPPRKQHPRLNDDFVQLADTLRQSAGNGTSQHVMISAVDGRSNANLRSSRLIQELRDLSLNPHPYYDCYCSETDMSFMKVVIEGPPESPYAVGTFVLCLDAGDGYPSFAPSARFETPILHANVNAHGSVCHAILDRDWTSDCSMRSILNTIYGLLFQPEVSDPVNTTVALGVQSDPVAWTNKVREHVRKHAMKTRAGWKDHLLGYGKDESEIDSESGEGAMDETEADGEEDSEMDDVSGEDAMDETEDDD